MWFVAVKYFTYSTYTIIIHKMLFDGLEELNQSLTSVTCGTIELGVCRNEGTEKIRPCCSLVIGLVSLFKGSAVLSMIVGMVA